jgi:hypothetical protein
VLEPKQISPLGQADPSWPLYARSLLWRGALHERLGERDAAIDSYRRFVSLWRRPIRRFIHSGTVPAPRSDASAPRRDGAPIALTSIIHECSD